MLDMHGMQEDMAKVAVLEALKDVCKLSYFSPLPQLSAAYSA